MITLHVNGSARAVDDDPQTPLLYVLRDTLQLNAAKFGCGLAQCGSCMVLIDDEAVPSCVMPIAALAGKKITTLEGLDTTAGKAVQKAWAEMDVVQCGWCQSGQMLTATALLTKTPKPSEQQITDGMTGNLCRCATYHRIRGAVARASEIMG